MTFCRRLNFFFQPFYDEKEGFQFDDIQKKTWLGFNPVIAFIWPKLSVPS